jgi:hypothetical protein
MTQTTVLDTTTLYTADTPALLDRQIDDLLLHARGLEVVRDLLSKKGASRDEVVAHSRALESTRARLADLIRGTGHRDDLSTG